MVDIEFDSTEIAIIVEGVPQFSRTVPIGIEQMYASISQAMGSNQTSDDLELLQNVDLMANIHDDTEAQNMELSVGTSAVLRVLKELIDELGRSINFYLNQSEDLEIAQLLLAGPGAAIERIDEFLLKN